MGVPWEILYVDDLVVIADFFDEYVQRFQTWKKGMEKKGPASECKEDKSDGLQ